MKYQAQIVAIEPGTQKTRESFEAKVVDDVTVEADDEAAARLAFNVRASATQRARRDFKAGTQKELCGWVWVGAVDAE